MSNRINPDNWDKEDLAYYRKLFTGYGVSPLKGRFWWPKFSDMKPGLVFLSDDGEVAR